MGTAKGRGRKGKSEGEDGTSLWATGGLCARIWAMGFLARAHPNFPLQGGCWPRKCRRVEEVPKE